MKPAFLGLVITHEFIAMDHKDPYTHLSTFYELVKTVGFQSGDIEFAYLHLFPFSLGRKAKEWLKSHPNQNLTIWKNVEKKFLQIFCPLSRYIEAKFDISMFRQDQMKPSMKHGKGSK